jgi:arginyl-tRNA--protein-N-Asp/Glu arginylyltransferase
MKEFHAELAANPAHYSYGYSVYGELEPGDDLADIFRRGYQPFAGAPDIPPMVYMARNTRVRAQEFKVGEKLRRMLRKFEGERMLTITDFLWNEYPEQDTARRIILEYFTWRHGSVAMPSGRLDQILAFQDAIHLIEYRVREEIVGYSIELHVDDAVYMWYIAYTKRFRQNLGARIVLDVVMRAKEMGKTYAYLGSSHGWHMRYKGNYQPLEWWDGRRWQTVTGAEFRSLLSADALRTVVSVDAWRSLVPGYYYPAPFRFRDAWLEVRFVYDLLMGTPRVGIGVALWLCLMLLVLATTLFP